MRRATLRLNALVEPATPVITPTRPPVILESVPPSPPALPVETRFDGDEDTTHLVAVLAAVSITDEDRAGLKATFNRLLDETEEDDSFGFW